MPIAVLAQSAHERSAKYVGPGHTDEHDVTYGHLRQICPLQHGEIDLERMLLIVARVFCGGKETF